MASKWDVGSHSFFSQPVPRVVQIVCLEDALFCLTESSLMSCYFEFWKTVLHCQMFLGNA